MKEQAKNKRRIGPIAKKYEVYGEEISVQEIEKRYGISEQLFKYRISKGMNNEEAIETKKILGKKYSDRWTAIIFLKKVLTKCYRYDINNMSKEKEWQREDKNA